jgi:hypothetical protein
MDGRFLDAFTLLPRQRVICGYETKPLCLRHRLVLTRLKSPFVDGNPEISPANVLVAAKIMSAHTLGDMLSDKPSKQDLAETQRMIDDVDYFVAQVGKIYDCIRDQSHWPTFWKKTTTGGNRGVPWILSIVCGLVKGGVPLEDAWTMPESQAVWMQAAIAVSNGADIDILSDEDIAAQRKLDEIYAKLEAANNV